MYAGLSLVILLYDVIFFWRNFTLIRKSDIRNIYTYILYSEVVMLFIVNVLPTWALFMWKMKIWTILAELNENFISLSNKVFL